MIALFCFTETNSLRYDISTEDVYVDIREDLDKRHILDDGIHTLAQGHFKTYIMCYDVHYLSLVCHTMQ